MKKSWLAWLLIGLLGGMLLTVPWATSAPIQSQVGINTFRPDTGTWLSQCDPLTDGDNVNTTDIGTPCTVRDTQSIIYGFDGTNFDRVRTAADVPDSSAAARTGLLAAATYAFDGTVWNRHRQTLGTTDALAGGNVGAAGTILFNGTTWDRARSASANLLTLNTQPGIRTVALPASWQATNTPAANVQATAARAAGAAGVRHIATSIHACSQEAVLANSVFVNVRDGATGAGTVIWTGFVKNLVNDSRCINVPVSLIGSAATAMTLEFTAAGGAGNRQTVTLTGYSVL